MRNFYYIILLLVAAIFTACDPNGASINLNPNVLQMKPGDIQTIEIVGASAGAEWTSSNEEVATVYYGVVTAKAIGSSIISVKVGKQKATCQVYVTGSDGATLRITPALVNLERGETFQFTYGNTYNLDITWSSSDESIASVTQDGLVTAHKSGNATITLATNVGTATAIVAVKHHWGNYQLIWSDEFNGSTLDESNWAAQIGGGGWGNQEAQYYTNRTENLRVADGCLIIEARKENYENHEYTSARIYSKGKREFCYGKLEASISLPAGVGTWPAFWTLGNKGSWPNCGEIDIMEHTGSAPNRIFGTLHTVKDRYGSKSSRAYTGITNIENNFHVYGIEWTQEEKEGKDVIRFYIDDVVYSEQVEEVIDDDEYWPFNRPNYFIINLALGGTLGGNIHDDMFTNPVLMKVDWVRVYQRQEIE